MRGHPGGREQCDQRRRNLSFAITKTTVAVDFRTPRNHLPLDPAGRRAATTVAVWMLRLDSELNMGRLYLRIDSESCERPSRRGADGLLQLDEVDDVRRRRVLVDCPLPRSESDGPVRARDCRHADFGGRDGRPLPEHVRQRALAVFRPRPLIEDNSQRSPATSLFELASGYQVTKQRRVTATVFNLLNSAVSDVDCYFATRLQGEPAGGIEDRITHPSLLRSARVNLSIGF
jgi:hypothetical protein